MIELLGIAMPSPRGGWLFRRLSARVETAELIAVVSEDRDARLALLDAVSARRVPNEGRVWLNGQPLTTGTQPRIRARAVEIDLHASLAEHRSLLWNVQCRPTGRLQMVNRWRWCVSGHSPRSAERALASVGLHRLANERVRLLDPWIRRRGLIAQALVSEPEVVVVPEIEHDLSLSAAADVLAALRLHISSSRLTAFVSTAEPILVHMFAQRVLAIAEGNLRFNGPPSFSMAAAATSTPVTLVATG